ncbi:MAG: NUDIX hydrolase [Candidatus Binataceae bacterium]
MPYPEEIARHIARLRRGLAVAQATHREGLANNRNAASVLVPMFHRDDDLHLVYIRRSDNVASHRGQVAFPGGRVDPSDQSALAAALREANEEVGIDPATVEVLGAFPTMSTMSSGMIVAPFVGLIPADASLRPQPEEVADIFDVPLSALRDPRHRGNYQWSRDGGGKSQFPAILYGGQTIWGLTLRITLELIRILDGAES